MENAVDTPYEEIRRKLIKQAMKCLYEKVKVLEPYLYLYPPEIRKEAQKRMNILKSYL